jgi:hypothetical protein
MRFTIVTLLAMASTGGTVALAQDGSGHGPPRTWTTPIIVVPQIPMPTTSPSTGTVQKFFQPASGLVSTNK